MPFMIKGMVNRSVDMDIWLEYHYAISSTEKSNNKRMVTKQKWW